jgi:hypothetical protein
MIKLLTRIVQIRVYKWLINWHQVKADSWIQVKTKDTEDVMIKMNVWQSHQNAIERLTDKLENI